MKEGNDVFTMETEHDLEVGSRIMLRDDKTGMEMGWHVVTKSEKLSGAKDGLVELTLERETT